MNDAAESKKSFLEQYDRGAMQLRTCPLCSHAYNESGIELLFEESGVHLVHITCIQCQSKVLNIVTISDIGMSSVGLFTDLNADDVVSFYEKDPISEDDVLRFHHMMNREASALSELLQN